MSRKKNKRKMYYTTLENVSNPVSNPASNRKKNKKASIKPLLKLDPDALVQTKQMLKDFGLTELNKQKIHRAFIRKPDTLKNYAPFLTIYSKNIWSTTSKNGGSEISPMLLNVSGKMSPVVSNLILNMLRNSIDDYGKLKATQPFIYSDDFYHHMIKTPKTIIAEDIYTLTFAFGKKLCIRQLLMGEYKEKKYLFSHDIMINENDPQIHASLSLLVNGNARGLKPIARYDTVGYFQPQFLKENNVLPTNLEEKLSLHTVHINSMDQSNGDIVFPSKKVLAQEHMHLASHQQDLLYTAKHYLCHKLHLQNGLTSAKLNAYGTDLYGSNKKLKNALPVSQRAIQQFDFAPYQELLDHKYNKFSKESIIRRQRESNKTNGIIPSERIYHYVQSKFSITQTRFKQNFFKDIDKARDFKQPDIKLSNIHTLYKQDYFEKLKSLQQDPATTFKHSTKNPVVLEGLSLTKEFS